MTNDKNALYSKTFTWLGIGLLITFAMGYFFSTFVYSPALAAFAMIGVIAELVIAFVLGLAIQKLSPTAATVLYLIYCVLSGINFSLLFNAYKLSSIIFVFLVTSAIFLLFAFIGKVAKVDFRKLGTFLLFTLIAIIVMSIINIFLQSNSLEFGLCIVSIVVFMLYILYDMKIIDGLEGAFGTEKAAVYGAFQLYIDFINLFIDILRLIGKAKD